MDLPEDNFKHAEKNDEPNYDVDQDGKYYTYLSRNNWWKLSGYFNEEAA